MSFRESALARLHRYRKEADRSLGLVEEAEGVTRGFAGRLFRGLEYTAGLGSEAGFETEARAAEGTLVLKTAAGRDAEAQVAFAVVDGAAAETDEDLMHEELSRYSLDPSGYSGRILGFSEAAGDEPCQTFAVYRDGLWKTKGLFVARARGKTDDPDDVLHGFCLRIVGRLIDLAAMTGGAGRRWGSEPYTLRDRLAGVEPPTETRWPR